MAFETGLVDITTSCFCGARRLLNNSADKAEFSSAGR
jgi:hypothetical protein